MQAFRVRKNRTVIARFLLCSLFLNNLIPTFLYGYERQKEAAILLAALQTPRLLHRAPRPPQPIVQTLPLSPQSAVCCPLPRDVNIAGDLYVRGNATIMGTLITPSASFGGRSFSFFEDPLNGTDKIVMQAPASLPTSYFFTLPDNPGSPDQILTTDGSGTTSWTTLGVPSGIIFNGGNSFGAPILIGTNDNFGLNLETNGNNRLQISNTGVITINNLASAGVVHTNGSGVLSTSLIVDADISATANIADTKLATISTAGKVSNSATTATSANTANAIVARDASGNFSAGTITASLVGSVTGAASLNVLKAGDTMTGNLVMANQNQIRLSELTINGTNFAALQAPASLASDYTLTLPTNTGSAGQILSTDGTGVLSWVSSGVGAISQGGNSFGTAVTIGSNDNFGLNLETNNTNRLQISNTGTVTVNDLVGTGDRYVQASSSGALSSVIPTGIVNVVQVIQNSPTVTGKYYPDIKSAVDWANANATAPTAIVIEAGTYSVGQTITVTNAFIRSISGSFATKIVPTGALVGSPIFVLSQVGTVEPFEVSGLVISGVGVAGWSSTAGSVGIQIAGSGQFFLSNVIILSGYQGVVALGGVSPIRQVITMVGSAVALTGDCNILVDNGANFNLVDTLLTSPGTQLIRAQHTNALAPITNLRVAGGRHHNDTFGTGTGLLVKDNAVANVSGVFYRTLQNIFVVQDSATLQTISNVSVAGTVTNYQQNSATARLTATGDYVYGATDSSKFVVTDSANVLFDIIDAATGQTMIGKFADTENKLITFLNGHGTNDPSLNYENSWFGWRGDVLNFPTASLVGAVGGMRTLSTEDFDATLMSIVRGAAAHSNNTLVNLATYQSTGNPETPDLSLLRTWQLTKEATTHNYVMNYWNGATTTKYLTLTPLGKLGLGTATPNSTLEVGTGQIAAPAGTAANPSYTNSSDTDMGMYFPAADTLGFSTSGVQRLSISPTGVVTINNLTPAGVVHNDSSGNLSTSLIVNADVSSSAAIADTKLATISTAGKVANSATTATSANTANAIVARDASGNFSAGTITANLTGNITGNLTGNVTGAASLNVLKAGDTMTGSLVLSGGSTNLTVGGTTNVQTININGTLHALSASSFDQGVPGIQANILQVTTGALSGPNQFNSIKTAVDSITTNSATNPFIVNVGPGVYVEDTITLKPFVALIGESAAQTIIEVDATSKDVIIGSVDSVVDGFTLRGATDGGKAAVVFTGGFGSNFIIRNCVFGNNDILINHLATTAPFSFLTITNCITDLTAQFTTGISSVNSGVIVSALYLDGFISTSLGNALFSEGIIVSGPQAFAIIRNFSITGSQISPVPGSAVVVQDGANVTVAASDLVGFQRGLYVPNAGVGPFISISAVLELFNTEDVRIDNPFTMGSLNGTFDRTKVFIDPSADISVFFVDPVNQGTVTSGLIYQGDTVAEITNVSPQIQQGSTLGVFEGGALSDGGGLSVTAASGNGYLMVGSFPNDYLQYITWTTQTIALPANADSYIYVDNLGVVQSSLGQPDIITTISLGKVRTNGSAIVFLQEQEQDGTHLPTDLDYTLRQGLGPIYEAGSIVSKNGTLQLNVSSGSYFFGSLNYSPLGGTAISWDAFYSNGSGNLNVIVNQNMVDYDHYDDGSGTLALIPVGEFARHAFYVVNDGAAEKYLLVYGQVVYPTLIDAQNGTIPPEPGSWNGNIALIASIIVENTAVPADQIQEIRDERPRLGFKASGISVVTNHGDLTGLLDDDHPQYLLDNGTRPLSGNLNLAGNNIINATLINGIDITNNASRYLPNGADPLATGVPVTINNVNSAGIANAFSRSDHVHAHGNQPGGTLHAVATTSTAGFMSAADKTLLDSINPSLYVLKTGSTMTGALNINPVSGNALTVNSTGLIVDFAGNTTIGGSLTISPLTTGIAHVNGSGVVSSSLIVNADVAPAAGIVDTKLATISTAGKVANSATTATSANTPSTIIARDGSGNFNAGSITLENQGQLLLQELQSNGTNTVALQAPALVGTSYAFTVPDSAGTSGYVLTTDGTGVTSWTQPSALAGLVLIGGNTNGSNITIGTNDDFAFNLETNGTTRIGIANDGPVTISNLASTGVVHTNGSGLLSTSLIVNADVSPIAAIADTKLATISTAGKVANSATTATTASSPNTIVLRDASGNFSAGTISAALVGNVTGNVTGAASDNVLKAGDTMTGNLVMANQKQIRFSELTTNGVNFAALQAPASLTADYTLTLPSDAGSSNQVLTTDGAGVLSWQNASSLVTNAILQGGNSFGTAITIGSTDNFGLNLITNATNRLVISNAGTVTIPNLSTTGVVHNSSAGLLTTSLIVNADVDPAAAIVDTKLATISTAGKVANSATTATSANTANALVARDASGDFSAGTITANLVGNVTGAASLNVLKAGDTMTGALQLPAGTPALPALRFTGSTTTGLSAQTADTLVLSTAGASSVIIDASGVVTIPNLSPAGVVHNNNAGVLTSSLIVNNDIDSAAAITDTKLATIVTAGKVANSATTATSSNTPNAIVLRDGLGNFAAGTITANLTGNVTGAASLNVLKAGDTMTGTLQLPAGTASAPSLVFTGSTTTGISAQTANTLVLSTAGLNRVQISSTGNVTIAAPSAGVGLTIAGGGLTTTGTTTLSSLGIGVVQSSGAGVLSSSAGANGQLLIGAGVGAAPVWANLTSTGGTVAITNGAGTINLETSGATANSFVTGSGTATPSSGVLNVPNGSNINTTGSGNTLTVNLVNSPSVSGSLSAGTTVTAGTGITATTGNITATTGNLVATAGNITANSGTLQVSAGTAAAPAIKFTGSTTTGLSAAVADTLVLGTAGTARLSISPTGTVTIPNLSSTGVVHNSAAGLLSTSLIVNADVDPAAAIVDTKLATISTAGKVANSATTATSANTANAIVARDASGNFSAGTITANLTGNVTGSASLNVLKAGDTMTGALQLPAGTAALPALVFTGSTTTGLSAATADTLVLSTAATSRMQIASTGGVTINAPSTGNALAITGNATSPTVSITSNAAQNSIITSLGAVGTPAYSFIGDTNTGIYSPGADQLSFATGGTLRSRIDASGNVTNQMNYKVHAYRSTTQNINATTANIVFDTAVIDTNSNFNTTTGTYTAPIAGVYWVAAVVTMQTTNQPSARTININKNGTAQTGYSVADTTSTNNVNNASTVMGLISLAANDTITIGYTTNKNDNIQANSTHVTIYYLSF